MMSVAYVPLVSHKLLILSTSDTIAQMSGAGGDPQDDAIKQVVKAEKKAAKKKKVKSEGYQRNPEKGEAEERKRSKKVELIGY